MKDRIEIMRPKYMCKIIWRDPKGNVTCGVLCELRDKIVLSTIGRWSKEVDEDDSLKDSRARKTYVL